VRFALGECIELMPQAHQTLFEDNQLRRGTMFISVRSYHSRLRFIMLDVVGAAAEVFARKAFAIASRTIVQILKPLPGVRSLKRRSGSR
jgi:hypothetical protein